MIKFSELLEAVGFEFDVVLDNEENPVLSLVDTQGAYLGGEDTYKFSIDLEHVRGSVISAVSRLDIFWQDSLVKDIIDSADETSRSLLIEKSSYYPDLISCILTSEIRLSDVRALDMLTAVVKPQSIDIDEVHRKLLEICPLSRNEIKRYLLDQGACISYNEKGERYIEEHNVDVWLATERKFQLTYAIRESMDLIDYDEWQALETCFYGAHSEALPSYVASMINYILWSELDETPLDFCEKVPP